MKGRRSGHIVQKDGNTFKVKSVKHNNDKGSDNKTLFGFSAEQRQKRLGHVGHSSAHNEYMAITAAIKRTVWLRQLISELSACQEVLAQPTVVLGDNLQANRLCREHFITPGNQYIAISYHYNKEQVDLGTVTVRWLSSAANLADLMTKPVSRQVLAKLLGALTGYSTTQSIQDLLASIK